MTSSPLLKALASAMPSLRWQVASSSTLAAGAFFGGSRGFSSKETTGIVGLPVDEDARQHLGARLQEVLDALKVIPADAGYRQILETTLNAKLAAVNSDAPDAALEEQFGRQLEQEIKLCKDELKLIPQMLEWQPW